MTRFTVFALLSTTALFGQLRPLERAQTDGHLLNPAQRQFSESQLATLRLPAGFRINTFARDLGHPRMMALAADGSIYLTRREEGDVLRLADLDRDGRVDQVRTVVQGLPLVHGITIFGGRLYLVTTREVYAGTLDPQADTVNVQAIVRDLPDAGQHPNRTIAAGPDGQLYVTIGSTCNACPESNPENATIVRMTPDGSRREIFAKGLRNTIGFGWQPATLQLYGMDMGSDWRGDTIPPDELNRIEQGRDYGWPFCWADRQIDRHISQAPMGTTREAYCARTEAATGTYDAHASPVGMVFYNGNQFPAEYRGDAIIAFRGSWNRDPASGYKLVRARFRNGQFQAFEDFATGWLTENGEAYFGRPTGLLVAADGSLLVSDDRSGVIYRISYAGQ